MKIDRPESDQPIPDKASKVFEGVIFDVWQWEQEMYDGSKATFEKLRRPDSVNVLPITDEGKIVVTQQEQPGTKPFWGNAGGVIDPGETALEAGKRELLEEAGMKAGKWHLLDATQLSSVIDWVVYTFVAHDLKVVGRPNLDAGEKIKLAELSFPEYLDLVARDDFRDKEVALMFLAAKQNGTLEEIKQKLGIR